MTPLLEAQELTLAFGRRRVVEQVSGALRGGEWLAIVGPNGAGKSTLLSLLAGLRRPDAGRVLLLGRELAAWPARERARHLAWLAQQGEADGELAALDVVRLGRLPHQGLLGAAGAEDEAVVRAAMDETESAPFAARRLATLSGGERQRVLLARALAVRPRVLLLDEPTTHLDPSHQRALLATLAARARAGAAVASVLHDVTSALAADRVWVMARGRLVADGAPREAGLRAALVAVFDGAFSIEPLERSGTDGATRATRWVAVPAP